MNWGSPQFLYFLFFIPVFVFVFVFKKIRRNLIIKKYFQKTNSIFNVSPLKENIRFIMFLISFFFLVVSASKPKWGEKAEITKGKGVDVVFCVDVSKSMLCEDIKPSRIELAKLVIRMLGENLVGNRVGLVAFAGDAYILCPLTTDVGVFTLYLDLLKPQFFPYYGTNIGKALEVALRIFDEKSVTSKIVIIISDGEDLTGNINLPIGAYNDKGIRIFTIGIGTKEGAPVPEIDSLSNIKGYKKDDKGEMVISKPNEVLLANIAAMGKGGYIGLNRDPSPIIGFIEKMKKGEFTGDRSIELEDRYQYFLIVSIITLLIGLTVRER